MVEHIAHSRHEARRPRWRRRERGKALRDAVLAVPPDRLGIANRMRLPPFFFVGGSFRKKSCSEKKLDLDRGCLLLLPPPTKHNGAVQQNTTALCNDTQQAHSHTKQQQSGAACGLITLATKTKIQSAGRHHRPVPREVGGPVATPPAQYGAGTSHHPGDLGSGPTPPPSR